MQRAHSVPLSLVLAVAAVPAALAQAATAQHSHAPAQPSVALGVTNGSTHVSFTLAELQALPQTTVNVFNAHSKMQESFTGPLVSEVLAKAGVVLSPATEHGLLHSYVLAQGSDGYFVVFSGAELQPALHRAQCIVALTRDGEPLGPNGAFQLVATQDVKPARWVRNLQSLTVNRLPDKP